MINITKRSELFGAEKYGSCASCGLERDVWKMSFSDTHGNYNSLSICHECAIDLMKEIYKEILNKDNTCPDGMEEWIQWLNDEGIL